MKKKRVPEFRADLKTLNEQRDELMKQMKGIVDASKAEERAMSDDEQTTFNDLEKKIKGIDATIAAEERARDLGLKVTSNEKHEAEERAETEERAFDQFLRGKLAEMRAGEIQLTQGNNGSIVPTTIANRIIKAVKDMVPYLQLSDVIPTGGKLSIPVYGEDSTNYIMADYVDEGTDLTDNIGKFTTIDLNGFVIGALSLVSKKLINNNDFDLVSFVVNKMAESMAEKLEKEFTVGTSSKITGVCSTTNVITSGSATTVTYDELVKTKHKLKQRFQKNAKWIMNDDTYTTLCLLKDGNGQPYFKDDDYKILNRDVLISDSMPGIAAGNKAIVFADLSGYTIKETQSVEIQVLIEKFSTKNMIGVLAFGEYDGKITDTKKITALQQKSA